MSLAQDKSFKPRGVLRSKLAWKIPMTTAQTVERVRGELIEDFKKMNDKEKDEFIELLYEASRIALNKSRRRGLTQTERVDLYNMASHYARLRSELLRIKEGGKSVSR